jgi:hypothetical protein
LKDNNSILSPKIFPAKSMDMGRGSSLRSSYQGGKATFINEKPSFEPPTREML